MNITERLDKIKTWESTPILLLCIAFAIVFSVFSNITPVFVNTFLLNNTAPICVALGVTAAIISGGIDLSGGGIVTLSAVSMVILWSKGWNPVLVLVIGVVVGLACGLLNGIFIGVFRVTPLLVTFASNSMFLGLSLWLMPFPGGMHTDRDFATFFKGNIAFVPVCVIFLAAMLAVWFIAIRRRMGIHLYATGQNEMKAYLSGANVVGIKIFAYTYGGLTASVGAMALTASYGAASPDVGSELSMVAIAAAALGGVNMDGGQGNAWGGVLGAFFLAITTGLLVVARIDAANQLLSKGLMLLAAVILAAIIQKNNRRLLSGGQKNE
jgi:ribose transport system permease protein